MKTGKTRRPPAVHVEVHAEPIDLGGWVGLYVRTVLSLERIVTDQAAPIQTPPLARAS